MTIYQTIQKDKLKPGANRAELSLIMGEICIDGKPMDDAAAIVRLTQMKKTCEKNLKIYQDAGAAERWNEEEIFMNTICGYLPKGAEKEDVERVLSELNLPKEMKSMGPLMATLKREFAVVDGNLVKSILIGGK